MHLVIDCLQEALEAHDGASKGKYTIGLGQDCMAFCSEVEDVVSMRYVHNCWFHSIFGIRPPKPKSRN